MPKKSSRKSSARRTNTRSSRSKTGSNWRDFAWLLSGLVLVLVVVGWFLGWRLYKDDANVLRLQKAETVTGTLHFTALKPDPTDKGTIRLQARRNGSESWQRTGVKIPLSQDAAWEWDDALPGVVYDLRAELEIDGKARKDSRYITITPPATDVELPIEVNWKDLPKDVVEGSVTKVGGTVKINGYIPDDAVLEIFTLDAPDAKDVITQLNQEALSYANEVATIQNPTFDNRWEWNEAIPLEEYEVIVTLSSGGETYIAPQLVFVDAGEVESEHVINSPFQPSVLGVTTTNNSGKVHIGGTVKLLGPKKKDTSLLMLWRKPGDANYNVVNRYNEPANAGTDWTWADAVSGQAYQIQAVLQVDGNNSSTAPNPITVAAPAGNVNFTINTYYDLPHTTGVPVKEVCIDRSGDSSVAVIRIPTMPNAGNYWVQVGSDQNQFGNTYNQKFSAGDNSQPLKVQVGIPDKKPHFVRYSYATCVHCQDDNNFAPWSETVAFTCD